MHLPGPRNGQAPKKHTGATCHGRDTSGEGKHTFSISLTMPVCHAGRSFLSTCVGQKTLLELVHRPGLGSYRTHADRDAGNWSQALTLMFMADPFRQSSWRLQP